MRLNFYLLAAFIVLSCDFLSESGYLDRCNSPSVPRQLDPDSVNNSFRIIEIFDFENKLVFLDEGEIDTSYTLDTKKMDRGKYIFKITIYKATDTTYFCNEFVLN